MQDRTLFPVSDATREGAVDAGNLHSSLIHIGWFIAPTNIRQSTSTRINSINRLPIPNR
jgi:hypothetical protein